MKAIPESTPERIRKSEVKLQTIVKVEDLRDVTVRIRIRAGAKLELSVSALVSYNPSLLSLDVEIASPVLHSAHWSGPEEHWKSADLTFATLQNCCHVVLWQSCLYQKTKYSFGDLDEDL